MEECGLTYAKYVRVHFKMFIEPAPKVLDFASRCNHTFTDLQGVYGYFSELLSSANDDELRFSIVQS